MHEKVMKFIHRFTDGGKNQGVIEAFKYGCCYWFAHILMERFYDVDEWRQNIDLMYDPVANHFGCSIEGIVYDISGDVTDEYDWIKWSQMDDDLLVGRIIRDCVMF